MSGRSEARLLIKDSGKLGETAVARRVERLFAVEVALAPVVGAPGSQQEEQGDCWVTLSGATSDKTEKAKVWGGMGKAAVAQWLLLADACISWSVHVRCECMSFVAHRA